MSFGLPCNGSVPRGSNLLPLVKRDITEALKYYDGISTRLADEFHMEVRSMIAEAAANPLRFHLTDHGFRRAN
jgi:hypothetical protein